MEIVATTPNTGGGVSPFHNHDVREWSHVDSLTGVLERARLETDHWAASTANSSHKYNKVVDSRARSGADGALQQRAKRQLEVFQSQVPGGRLQVIKTHTVSSSRWANTSSTNNASTSDFENLQLALNPLDLSSQKSKASVGRSVGRRPPSRPRAREESPFGPQNGPLPSSTAAANLQRVSRLCHQIHDNAVRQAFGRFKNVGLNGDHSASLDSSEPTSADSTEQKSINWHTNLTRTKSTSSEDLFPKGDKKQSTEDLEDLEQLQNWRRTSKIRRSLQFPKPAKVQSQLPPDLPINTGSVRKIKEDLETGRRLSTALRGSNNLDLDALDQILQSISSTSSTYSDKTDSDNITHNAQKKKNSFVTVESIQEVRGRLRRTSSPSSDIYQLKKEEETDDGIVTDNEKKDADKMESRVKSYVFEMENNLSKKGITGTGSLESRSKQYNNYVNRNEDWYNRRKSYGFEQVHNHQEPMSTKTNNKVESSTDSGICRSTEIVVVPSIKLNKTSEYSSESESEKRIQHIEEPSETSIGSVKRFSSYFERNTSTPKSNGINIWNKQTTLKDKVNGTSSSWKDETSDLESTTITIPIGPTTSNNLFNNKNGNGELVMRNKENGWHSQDHEIKRHSIAVDEYKYATKNVGDKVRRTSLAINDKSYDVLQDNPDDSTRKTKKVEFCKTEVHFTADSGKVNIVETDEKPPPTNNFRRRRRLAGLISDKIEDFNKVGLPVLHFGDTSFEKSLLGVTDPSENDQGREDSVSCTTVTVNSSTANYHHQDVYEEDQKENIENEVRKGILKNKPIKPKPYLLGEIEMYNGINTNSTSHDDKWGVKLKPVNKENDNNNAMWRSTVTVKNTFFDNQHFNHRNDSSNESWRNGDYGNKNGDYNNYNDEYKKNDYKFNNGDYKRHEVNDEYNKIINHSIEDYQRSDDYILKNSDYRMNENGDYSPNEEYGKNDGSFYSGECQPEFQKLLKNLKPTSKKSESFCEVKKSNSGSIRIVSPLVDTRRASWSVADRVKQVEDLQWTENKGYSTKVNIGSESTVVENGLLYSSDHHSPNWTKPDDSIKDVRKHILNKGLVVRIGREDSKHTVCSKTTTNQEVGTTTTTKITIDLTPSPTNDKSRTDPFLSSSSSGHNFKSTSLILSTIKSEFDSNQNHNQSQKNTVTEIPKQLEALRKLYEDVQSDSEADKEVQALMDRLDEDIRSVEDDSSSVVSGSWSRMRAFKNIKQHFKTVSKTSDTKIEHIHAHTEKDYLNINSDKNKERKHSLNHPKPIAMSNAKYLPASPKLINRAKRSVLYPEKISTPKNTQHQKVDVPKHIETEINKTIQEIETQILSDETTEKCLLKKPTTKMATPLGKEVLRQPKKSEMAYFGVPTSPQANKKKLTTTTRSTSTSKTISSSSNSKMNNNKPDLLQFNSTPKINEIKHAKKVSTHEEPTYENVTELIKQRKSGFDSSILEELTKAADQIMQAVNGYTDEDSQHKLSTDDEEKRRQLKREPLDTIIESKSWKQTQQNKSTQRTEKQKSPQKLKHTSSTSSVESVHISRECRKSQNITPVKNQNTSSRQTSERQKKKIISNDASPTVKANTRARRLQRASSREALLQSHGSSSEDLGASVEVSPRKPRLVRRTKTAQLTMTNGLDLKKPTSTSTPIRKHTESTRNKISERLPVAGLPEIRHKTAVSTIKSTAEKAASRERKHEDTSKKKTTTKRETPSRTHNSTPSKQERSRVVNSREVVSHRVSTANIKKCSRADTSLKR